MGSLVSRRSCCSEIALGIIGEMNRRIIGLFVLIFDQGKLCRQTSSKGIICLRSGISFGICLHKEPAFCIIGGKECATVAIGSDLCARNGVSARVISVV